MRPAEVPNDAGQARRDLEWLRHVGALRSVETDEAGAFIVETPDRRLHALGPEQVAAFKAGVLAGWRLPRASGVVV